MKFTGENDAFFGCFEKHPIVVSGALRDVFRARKVFGSFEKRTPGQKICVRNKCCAHGQTGKHLIVSATMCPQQCVIVCQGLKFSFKKTATVTATATSLNKRFNEQNNICARAF